MPQLQCQACLASVNKFIGLKSAPQCLPQDEECPKFEAQYHSCPLPRNTVKMTTSTLLIEGSFLELAEELAQYIDGLSEGAGIASSIEAELNQIREAESQESPDNAATQKPKDDVLKKIITKATILNAAPERGEDLQCDG